jgi:hypothetical protein
MQEIRLEDVMIFLATPRQAAAMWSALATLRHLKTVYIGVSEAGGNDGTSFFSTVSLMTQIRYSHNDSFYVPL